MRARNIKPGFFCNEELVELSPLCRLFFIGLWCFADKEGYFEDRPLKIKMAIFPAEGHDVKAMLGDLCRTGFVTLFSGTPCNIYKINNFERHQRPHQNEPVSTLAPMVEGLAPMVEATCANGTSTWTGMRNVECGLRNGESPTSPGPQAAPAGHTDSLPFDLTPPPAKRKGTIANTVAARFEQFWAAVGKKQEKKAALAEFARINPDDELLVKMIAAMGVYQRNRPLEFQKAVHRWLKGECWNDELQTGPAPGAPRKPEQKTDMQRALERMAREMVDE